MGQMGGLDILSSSPSADFGADKSSNVTTNTDNSAASTAGASAGGDVLQLAPNISGKEIGTLNLLDQGALAGAQSILEEGFKQVTGLANKSADNANRAVSDALQLADKARQTDTQTVFGTIAKAFPWIALAAGLIGLAWWNSKKGKQ